eukprot:CAMPEP_0116841552 /NCGR_PEP_ID=MMETSP0418-20121206/11001_1 /TAXON_ID=1158023 /ORGANISM="Astrosyne radiata, Strain 13vi08-1A" /LENGTH=247 /DNA_ID=CAMNT_0004472017 /DNA_START=76 /DNA_END=819 /DNA_ORIENTATION=-
MPPLFHQPVTAGFLASQLATIGVTYVTLEAAGRFRNVSEALAFYGVYHRDGWNQLIHFFGVPGIIWSMLIMMAHLPLPFLGSYALSLPFCPRRFPINWANFITLFYIMFYLSVDLFGGLLYTPIVYAMYATAANMTRNDQEAAMKKTSERNAPWTGTGRLLRFAVFVHIFSWYVQIHPGHGILEGAKPAIMDSVGGALTSAPLFAFYEGLWYIGINKALQEQTHRLVAEYTVKLCAEGAVMRACAGL